MTQTLSDILNSDPVWTDVDEFSLPVLGFGSDDENRDVLIIYLTKMLDRFTLTAQFEPELTKAVAVINREIFILETSRKQIINQWIADVEKIPNIHRSNIQKMISWIEVRSSDAGEISDIDNRLSDLREKLLKAENRLLELKVRKEVTLEGLHIGIQILNRYKHD